MRRVSLKRQAVNRILHKRVVVFLEAHPTCGRCGEQSQDVHHMAGRIGARLLDETAWLAVCRLCHDHIGGHPLEALARGWSLPRVGRAS